MVSVVLPALNEQDTIGDIVGAIHTDLVQGARTQGVRVVEVTNPWAPVDVTAYTGVVEATTIAAKVLAFMP